MSMSASDTDAGRTWHGQPGRIAPVMDWRVSWSSGKAALVAVGLPAINPGNSFGVMLASPVTEVRTIATGGNALVL